MSNSETAAYFDLDGTLLDGSSEKALISALLKRRPWRLPLTITMWTLRCAGSMLIGRGWYDSARNRGHFTMSSWQELETLAQQIVTNNLSKKVSKAAKDRLQWHREQGHRIVLLSATIAPMAEAMGKELGVDQVYSSGPSERKGRLSGSEKGWLVPRNKGKVPIVQKDAVDNGHNFSKCWAYGNSYADVHFMALCGNAMAVNPDARLKRSAQEHGWSTVTWKA